MAFDGITIAAMVKELHMNLDGLTVDDYDQLSLDDLLELETFGLLFFVGSLE